MNIFKEDCAAMDLNLRLEQPADFHAVEELTRDAFWEFSQPTCEHLIAHKLRQVPAFVPELDYVAESDGKIVGNVMYSKAKIVDGMNSEHVVITFGPLSVLPQCWNQGIGSALMRYTIKKAKLLGYRAIVFYGHPDYYPRFGFERSEIHNITTPDGRNFDALMTMPLYDGALKGISGRFYEDPVFHVDAAEVAEFDNNFPRREAFVHTPIAVLIGRLDPVAEKVFQEHNVSVLAELNRYSGREIASWFGIDEKAMAIINETLKEYGYARKVFPDK